MSTIRKAVQGAASGAENTPMKSTPKVAARAWALTTRALSSDVPAARIVRSRCSGGSSMLRGHRSLARAIGPAGAAT